MRKEAAHKAFKPLESPFKELLPGQQFSILNDMRCAVSLRFCVSCPGTKKAWLQQYQSVKRVKKTINKSKKSCLSAKHVDRTLADVMCLCVCVFNENV